MSETDLPQCHVHGYAGECPPCRAAELLKQPCLCEQLPHSCDRCKELAEIFNPYGDATG